MELEIGFCPLTDIVYNLIWFISAFCRLVVSRPVSVVRWLLMARVFGSSPASVIFGRPFVKWFALCHRTIVLSVCLSVCL